MIQPLNKDWSEFVGLLNAHRVEYLIVGAFAVAHHGRPRLTGDLDIWVRPTLDNGQRIVDALASFGFSSLNLRAEDFTPTEAVIQLGYPPVRIDLITSLSGLAGFEEAWAERSTGDFGEHPAPYLGRRHLVLNKRSVGRHKDLGDIEELPPE